MIDGRAHAFPWRIAGWSIPPLLLLVPLIAGLPWTAFDFVLAGAVLGSAGFAFELAVRASSGSFAYRAGAGVAVATAVLLLWANGAVGFLGDENNPSNLMFLGVIAVAVVGSVLASFRPAGTARAMLATAVAQLLAGVVGLGAGFSSPGRAGLYEAAMGTIVFAALWLVSAALFRKAASERSTIAG